MFTTPPIATHVLQVAIGDFQHVRGPRTAGVRLRSFVPRGDVAETGGSLRLMPRHLRFVERRLGRYPFSRYGVLDTPLGGALEHQTLSTLSVQELTDPEVVDAVMSHARCEARSGRPPSSGWRRRSWRATVTASPAPRTIWTS